MPPWKRRGAKRSVTPEMVAADAQCHPDTEPEPSLRERLTRDEALRERAARAMREQEGATDLEIATALEVGDWSTHLAKVALAAVADVLDPRTEEEN